jgi:zinc transport system substrate-binding protein
MKVRKPSGFRIGLLLWMVAGLSALPFLVWSGESPSDKLTVYVVNYPLKYFAERIAGGHGMVVFPAPADVDPAFWIPDAKTILVYQRADLILLNGANYAKWVGKVSLPQFRLVDTSARFKNQYMETEDILTHSHGPQGEHAHEALAFTTWIDFSQAAKQAKTITNALSRKKPPLREIFEGNYVALEKDLMTLDRDIKTIVSKEPSKPLVASHPVYQYFQRRYGVNIKSVHWEPDEIPSDEQMMELQALLKNHPAQGMIWEGEPINESIERLTLLGIRSVVFDPCGNVPGHGDLLTVMRQNVENLKTAFR